MKLSVVMPSHNIGPRVIVSILNAASVGSDDVEVIIRDNSGNPEKRKFLSTIHEKNCRILSVDECSGTENNKALLEEAKGEFMFFAADDDMINGLAIPALLKELDKNTGDPGVVGATGIYALDTDAGTRFARFDALNKPAAIDRFRSFFGTGSPSIFQYSPIRRNVIRDVWNYASTLPVYLSYHDWLLNGLVLMHGRLTCIEHFIYHYHDTNWATPELCMKHDMRFLRQAGLDTSGVRVQWLVAAFEGAQTFINKYKNVDMPQHERLELGAHWFSCWLAVSAQSYQTRQAENAKFDAQALRLGEKWADPKNLQVSQLLPDICEYYALSSPEIAQRYYDFWK